MTTISKPFAGNYHMSQKFGTNPDFYSQWGYAGHNGVDWGLPVGTPLLACDAGTVVVAEWNQHGYGGHVRIQHDWGKSLYAHLSQLSVSKGQRVSRGQQIGLSGNTGASTGPHLHFGVQVNGVSNPAFKDWVDPEPYLTGAAQPAQWWEPILARYFTNNARMKSFMGSGVPGGFLAQDGNRIEFFQNGGLIVRPDGSVDLAPVGAWVGDEYRRKGTAEFQWAADRGGDNRYFPETAHNLFGDFKAAWQELYGKPVSEEFYLVLNGKAATCQMFEYAMMMHNPTTNQFELVRGRLSEVFLSMIEDGRGLGIIGPLVDRGRTRMVRALGEVPQPTQPPAAAPRKAREQPVAIERVNLRDRAGVLGLLELTANALLRGEIDVNTAEMLKDICDIALDVL